MKKPDDINKAIEQQANAGVWENQFKGKESTFLKTIRVTELQSTLRQVHFVYAQK